MERKDGNSKFILLYHRTPYDEGKDKDGNKIEIKRGRYGPYITNQKINAPFPKDKEIESLELDAALKIIDEKAAMDKARRK